MQYKPLLAALVASFAFFLYQQPVQAVSTPDFPSCTAIQGTVIAYHPTGTHGVPGDQTTYTGSDTVYRYSETQVLQCLCPENASGIQTVWWQYGELTEAELANLQSQGWIWIPSGAAWGLNDTPYLAKNSRFSCMSSGVGGTSGESNSGTGVGGYTLATSGQVLGTQLAQTGTTRWGLLIVAMGISSIVFGKRIKRSR